MVFRTFIFCGVRILEMPMSDKALPARSLPYARHVGEMTPAQGELVTLELQSPKH